VTDATSTTTTNQLNAEQQIVPSADPQWFQSFFSLLSLSSELFSRVFFQRLSVASFARSTRRQTLSRQISAKVINNSLQCKSLGTKRLELKNTNGILRLMLCF